MTQSTDTPRIGLALGAGGARGLAHIPVLEAFDELGLRPCAIAGSSMGAVVGAAYAAGMSGRELRAHVLSVFRNRADVTARLLQARIGRFRHMLTALGSNPVLLDGEILLDLFWPSDVPDHFEDLLCPFFTVATDFDRRCEMVFSTGPLAPAVAASMAIPGLLQPVEAQGAFLIDGSAVNPLPYRVLENHCDRIVACDVARGPAMVSQKMPTPFEAMFGAAQIMQSTLTAQMLSVKAPDILLRPSVDQFRALDFFRARDILESADQIKDEVKRSLDSFILL